MDAFDSRARHTATSPEPCHPALRHTTCVLVRPEAAQAASELESMGATEGSVEGWPRAGAVVVTVASIRHPRGGLALHARDDRSWQNGDVVRAGRQPSRLRARTREESRLYTRSRRCASSCWRRAVAQLLASVALEVSDSIQEVLIVAAPPLGARAHAGHGSPESPARSCVCLLSSSPHSFFQPVRGVPSVLGLGQPCTIGTAHLPRERARAF